MFRNSDPPQLAEVWRTQVHRRGLMQPMSAATFEAMVLTKPIFDRMGLVLAVEDGHVLGFVHAAFGPNDSQSDVSTETGVLSMIMMRMPHPEPAVAAELLRRGEEYLRSRGAASFLSGGKSAAAPFYFGLVGGSELAGVLESDVWSRELYERHGYQVRERLRVLHRELSTYRSEVDRRQMALRRRGMVEAVVDPPACTWWEACTFSNFQRLRFDLTLRDRSGVAAQAMFWDMEPLAAAWGVRAAGLIGVEAIDPFRRQGAMTFLLSEAFRWLQAQGISLVETQVPEENTAAIALFNKLGFVEVDRAAVYYKA